MKKKCKPTQIFSRKTAAVVSRASPWVSSSSSSSAAAVTYIYICIIIRAQRPTVHGMVRIRGGKGPRTSSLRLPFFFLSRGSKRLKYYSVNLPIGVTADDLSPLCFSYFNISLTLENAHIYTQYASCYKLYTCLYNNLSIILCYWKKFTGDGNVQPSSHRIENHRGNASDNSVNDQSSVISTSSSFSSVLFLLFWFGIIIYSLNGISA